MFSKNIRESLDNDPNAPAEVDVLEENDFCKESISNPQGQKCLIGWFDTYFDKLNLMNRVDTEELLRTECNRITKRKRGCLGIAEFNDSKTRKTKTLARVWNRFIARLGYVVNNPEAKNI